MAVTPEDRLRFERMAETYDAVAQYFVPRYDFLQNEMIRAAGLAESEQPVVVDLGAGGGGFLERVLEARPDARCYWVDSSVAFRAVAERRLERFGERVTFIHSRLEDPWEEKLPERPDFIFSMSAIHHLESGEKKRLAARAFETLQPGGWFINTDEMRTLNDDAYFRSLVYWVRHVESAEVPPELRDAAVGWRAGFERWKARNIENFGAPRHLGDDLHESFLLQLDSLKDAGFTNADCFVKFHLWAMIGGRKPLETD